MLTFLACVGAFTLGLTLVRLTGRMLDLRYEYKQQKEALAEWKRMMGLK